jgi:hypothetical protein
MISLTPRFRRKREVWLRVFAENAKSDPKTHSYEDSAKFNPAFSVTTLSHASPFRKLQISVRIWRIFSKALAGLRFVSISDWNMQKKSLKTDYENLVHVYL